MRNRREFLTGVGSLSVIPFSGCLSSKLKARAKTAEDKTEVEMGSDGMASWTWIGDIRVSGGSLLIDRATVTVSIDLIDDTGKTFETVSKTFPDMVGSEQDVSVTHIGPVSEINRIHTYSVSAKITER